MRYITKLSLEDIARRPPHQTSLRSDIARRPSPGMVTCCSQLTVFPGVTTAMARRERVPAEYHATLAQMAAAALISTNGLRRLHEFEANG